ncbi:MAG: hypothetical protein Fur005_11100 [Roseiflexaceae bacterium]
MDYSTPAVPEVVRSLLGQDLVAPTPTAAAVAQAEVAAAAFQQEPGLEQTIWYGRRVAYLGQYQRAIAIYTTGLKRFPHAHQLYRHRGHRFISIRQFERAISDFRQAAALAADQPVEIEPDGIPNAANRPLSNTHFNIWYHLGLAHYLRGEYQQAAEAYQTCMNYVDNDDGLTATTDWAVMTYRRLGDQRAVEQLLAKIHPDMHLIENHAYHRRLLLYKGLLAAEEIMAHDEQDPLTLVTHGYGVANWYLEQGAHQQALAIFEQILATSAWSAFGYIAAEVDVVRLRSAPR